MRGLERGDNPFQSTEETKSLERFSVGNGDVFRAAGIFEVGVLRTDTGIVQSGGDRVRGMHLAVLVLQEIAQRAMKHAGTPARERRRVMAAVEPFACRLDADQLDA